MRAKSYLLPTIVAFASCTGAMSNAHADETIVSEIIVTGLPGAAKTAVPEASKPVTSTVYFKGGQWRSESGGAVLLAGGPDGKVYALNAAAKTYYVSTGGLAAEALNNPMISMVKFHTKAVVEPAGETKTIAGKPAKNYKFNATVHMSLGDGDDPATDAMMPTIKIAGEEWTSEALDVPASPFGGGAGNFGKVLPGQLASGFSNLTTQLAAIKGFPLVNTMTMKFVFPEGSPFAAMAGDAIPKEITMKQTTTSVSEAPLSDDLFHVPADFKLVDAPAPPALPIPGGLPAAAPAAVTPPATPPPAQ